MHQPGLPALALYRQTGRQADKVRKNVVELQTTTTTTVSLGILFSLSLAQAGSVYSWVGICARLLLVRSIIQSAEKSLSSKVIEEDEKE